MTLEEALVIERSAMERSEFWLGQMVAMAGATENHEVLCSRLSFLTQLRLGVGRCQVFGPNMKVGVVKKRGFAYPDLSIACGERKFFDDVRDLLMNPVVVFEVLSDSTRAFDGREKFLEYQKLESLRHYVLVEQRTQRVEHYERAQAGRWSYEVLRPGDLLRLVGVGIEIPVSEIYAATDIPIAEEDE
ncbi:MAG: Uma2 family endonuclease [Acidobacteria bacterium]|nr:Uma2 family endonuclease [Acidobacteriota bacterium]